MFTLADVLEIRQGQFINNKDTLDGDITVIKNGSKQYKKDIKSNLSSECIIITKMSIDILYIEDFEKYYISSGAYILTIKKIYKNLFKLKYLYYIIKYKLIDIIKNYRHGALQQAINKTNLEYIFKRIYILDNNNIDIIEKKEKIIKQKEEELNQLKKIQESEIKAILNKNFFVK